MCLFMGRGQRVGGGGGVPLFMELFHLVLGARYQLIAISINLFSFFNFFFSV